jgi:predicted aspartyl protease
VNVFGRPAWPAALALALLCACVSVVSAAERREPLPPLTVVLARYANAIDDPGVPRPSRYEVRGTLAAAGLRGTFHIWRDGDREREDEELGPRRERVLAIGERITVADSNGNVRELRGVLLRRARTQEFIESGAFIGSPERCTLRGGERIGNRRTWVLDVSAPGGDVETLYLDAETGLPDRLAYDDFDGRETLDYSDWRTVGGHRFPFRTVVSDGTPASEEVEQTVEITLDPPLDDALFAPLRGRSIEARSVQTVPLTERNGHFFAPVRIGKDTFMFLVDSGAQSIALETHIATALSLSEEGSFEATGIGRTGGVHVARLPELGIGGATLRDLVISTLDLGAATGGALRIDGVLGYPFFAAAVVRLDTAKRTMTFAPPGMLVPRGTRLELELDRRLPEARLRMNGRFEGEFLLDTGNTAALVLYRPFVEAHPDVVPPTTNGHRSWGIGGTSDTYSTVLEALDLGGISVYNVETDVMLATRGAFADRVDAGNVGLGVWRNFILTFDFGSSALYLERGPNFDDGRNRTPAR